MSLTKDLNTYVWYPYAKGGDFRQWYGNNDFVVNWANDGEELKAFSTARNNGQHWSRFLRSLKQAFKPGITWSAISSAYFGVRKLNRGYLFDGAGSCSFPAESEIPLYISLLCSKPTYFFLSAINPTLNFPASTVSSIPIPKKLVGSAQALSYGSRAVAISQADWDNFETSWDFQTHPLLRTPHPRLADAFEEWQQTAADAFDELKQLEEENNRYWIDAYGLQDELTPEVPEEQVTVRRADLVRDIKSLISYAVGCMMGRYALTAPGLQFAGGTFDPSAFRGDFLPDADGILPITDEAYFEDDIVSRFVAFMRVAFGPEHLDENLTFVADALSRKGNESAVARIRRYFVSEFVSDHIQTYKKRPIYWLLTSGKGRAFGALIYLHRYTPDTLASVRNDYVLPLQSKLEAEIRSTERAVTAAASASAAKAESKRLVKLREQVAELLAFHDKLLHKADQRIEIDLDDGVAYNYTLFGDLLYTGADLKLADLMRKSQWKRDLLVNTSATFLRG